MKLILLGLIKASSLLFLLSSCRSESISQSETPVTSPAAIKGKDVDAIFIFMNKTGTWQKNLSRDGKEIGAMIGRMIKQDSYQDEKQIKENIALFDKKIDLKIREYQALQLPKVKEVQEFRKLLIEYLKYQRNTSNVLFKQVLPIAIDQKIKKLNRLQQLFTLFQSTRKNELQWKARLGKEADTVYEALEDRYVKPSP